MPFSFAPARTALAIGVFLASCLKMDASGQDRYGSDRREMLDEISRMARETRGETGRAAFGAGVMEAIARVDRHRLVPDDERGNAYRNRPLGIGLGQTISQPFIVALMTDLLDIRPGDKVLEVGTGSGYQAAVLAELGANVYTVEILEPLGREAAARLAELGYKNIAARIGDGYRGWSEHAPFDAIVVTAAARELPPALIEQLKPGGKLVIPLGESAGAQTLYVVEKHDGGRTTQREILAVRFVPLTGEGQKNRSGRY
jgi:protein-L-isoaspartate(D-aspartate) O-methyltransferase